MKRFNAAVVASALVAASCGGPGDAVTERATPVRVMTASPQLISEEVYVPARLEGLEEALIYPALGGRVEEVLVSEGDSVSAGTPLIRLSSDRQIIAGSSAAQAGVSAARAGEQNALHALERMRSLFDAGAISEQELETAEVMYESARAGLQQAQAGVQQAMSTADNSLITAPFAGRIGRIWVREGNMAGGGPAVSISNGSTLRAGVLVPEQYLPLLSPGLAARITVAAYEDESFPGVVTATARSVDPLSGLVSVDVAFENIDGRLFPGMSGRVAIAISSSQDALVVPEIAMRRSPSGVELVLARDGTASIVPVVTGIENRGMVEIVDGLEPGDMVIVEGQFRVAEGDKVSISED